MEYILCFLSQHIWDTLSKYDEFAHFWTYKLEETYGAQPRIQNIMWQKVGIQYKIRIIIELLSYRHYCQYQYW